ncbi:hypothetical protein SAMN04487904_101558 [Actinopolyspora lacussalsi subsp. righensis]|uniref:Uncharacterized protein n=1 Tax=Actinopolyspora righensis TaxID=995060 RepID=A0A1I6XGL2_9ACTN|nr:hypothetical protein SAMN04487904_101558 [Actinopolyspora righensis]
MRQGLGGPVDADPASGGVGQDLGQSWDRGSVEEFVEHVGGRWVQPPVRVGQGHVLFGGQDVFDQGGQDRADLGGLVFAGDEEQGAVVVDEAADIEFLTRFGGAQVSQLRVQPGFDDAAHAQPHRIRGFGDHADLGS